MNVEHRADAKQADGSNAIGGILQNCVWGQLGNNQLAGRMHTAEI